MSTDINCFAELFYKATIFDNIYQNLVVCVANSDKGFVIEVSCSYNSLSVFPDTTKAARYLANNMRVKEDYLKLRINVNRVCNLLREYAPASDDKDKVEINKKMLACLNSFADFLRHYEDILS